MKVKYDPEVDALYVRISDKPIVESVESASGAIVDLDEDGALVAIEVLDFKNKTNAPFEFALPTAQTPDDFRNTVLAK